MPVFIGDYLADTMHLTTEQHGAYLLLLFHLWRRGSLRDNDATLGKISGLGETGWKLHRATLAEFFKIRDGLWEHGRVDKEKARVAGVKQALTKKAKSAASSRWGKNDASGNARALLEHADSHSHSHSDSDSEADPEAEADLLRPELETQVPPLRFAPVGMTSVVSHVGAASGEECLSSEGKAASGEESLSSPGKVSAKVKKSAVSDGRHLPFRAILAQYWRSKNHASPEMPWQGRDGKALADFLKACPQLNETQFRLMVGNRARSAVTHGDRVYLWIANLTRFQEEITVYNKPASAGGGYASRAEINRNSVVSAVDGAFVLAQEHADRVRQAGAEPAGFLDAGVPFADGAGPGRCAVGLPGAGDHGVAAGHAAYGQTGADGPLPYRAAVTAASAIDRDGRQKVNA
jgi:uncharacterized protein YdaU (DUF1376 family)